MVESLISKLGIEIGDELSIDYVNSVDYDGFSLFPYNTKSYLKNGNTIDALAGNSPFIISDEGCTYRLINYHTLDLKTTSIDELLVNDFLELLS